MEELFEVVAFGAGASLAISAVNVLRRGFRATAKQIARGGLTMQEALQRVGDEARKIGDEARSEVRRESPRDQRKRKTNVRTIEIAPR